MADWPRGPLPCSMTGQFLAKRPELEERWVEQHPLGRIGRPDELRGVAVWLASNASSFCTGSEYVSRLVPAWRDVLTIAGC